MNPLPRWPIIAGLAVLAVVVHLSFCTWLLGAPAPADEAGRIARVFSWPGEPADPRPREIALYARREAGAAPDSHVQSAIAWGVVMPLVLLALAGLLAIRRRRPPSSGKRNGTRARDPALVLAVREQTSRRRATGSDR